MSESQKRAKKSKSDLSRKTPNQRSGKSQNESRSPERGAAKRGATPARRAPRSDWSEAAEWYDQLVGDDGSSLHREVILPRVETLLRPKAGEKALDLACGQGVAARMLADLGCHVTAVDLAEPLIEAARRREEEQRRSGARRPGTIDYIVDDARRLRQLHGQKFDLILSILALQNIDDYPAAIVALSRHAQSDSRLLILLNHPAFRIPRQSRWQPNANNGRLERCLSGYMLEQRIPIVTHPGRADSDQTLSYHRPLMALTTPLFSAGWVIDGLEELCSPRASQPGPHAETENRARAEFPLFLAIRARRR